MVLVGGVEFQVSVSGVGTSVAAINQTVASVNSLDVAAKRAAPSVRTLSGHLSDIQRVAGTLAAAFATTQLGSFIAGSALLAARVETLSGAVEQLGENAGISAPQVRTVVRDVEAMNITTQRANEAVGRLIVSEIGLEHATTLVRIAQDRGRIANLNSSESFLKIVQAIDTLQPRLLKQLGLNVNMNETNRKMAESLGKTVAELTELERKQGLLNGVLERGARSAGSYEESLTTAGGRLLSLQRHVEQARLELGQQFLPALGSVVSLTELAAKGFQEADGTSKALFATLAGGVVTLGAVTVAVRGLALVAGGLFASPAFLSAAGVITAIGAGLAFFSSKSQQAAEETKKLTQEIEDQNDALVRQSVSVAKQAVEALDSQIEVLIRRKRGFDCLIKEVGFSDNDTTRLATETEIELKALLDRKVDLIKRTNARIFVDGQARAEQEKRLARESAEAHQRAAEEAERAWKEFTDSLRATEEFIQSILADIRDRTIPGFRELFDLANRFKAAIAEAPTAQAKRRLVGLFEEAAEPIVEQNPDLRRDARRLRRQLRSEAGVPERGGGETRFFLPAGGGGPVPIGLAPAPVPTQQLERATSGALASIAGAGERTVSVLDRVEKVLSRLSDSGRKTTQRTAEIGTKIRDDENRAFAALATRGLA